MSKVRIYELARDLNVEAKIIMAKLKSSGVKVASHQSTLTDEQVAEIRAAFGQPNGGGAAKTAAPAAGAGAPRVVIRRRAASDGDASPGGDAPAAAEPAKAAPAAKADAPAKTDEDAQPSVAAKAAEPEAPAAQAAPVAEAPAQASAPASTKSATVVRSAPTPAPKQTVPPAQISKSAQASPPAAPAAAAQPTAPAAAQPAQPADAAQPSASAQSAEPAQPAVAQPPARPAAPAAGQQPGAGATARPAQAPAGPAGGQPSAPAPVRRRDVGGATIVRRATPEEVAANLESRNRQQTGRKEDHRGTRVTGIGLLSNRVSSDGRPAGGPPPPGGAPGEEDPWGNRRAGGGAHSTPKDKKAEEEEAARKKAAAKRRGTASGPVSMRALLEQVDELMGPDDAALAADPAAPAAGPGPSAGGPGGGAGRVYTPQASRNRRDIKRRKDLKKTQITTPRAAYRVVEMEDFITVGELARQMAVKATDVIKKLMSNGVMATINQTLDFDTATLMATEFGFETKNIATTVEDVLAKELKPEAAGEAITRPPIVTVMGHVDHGKTSILDAIRQANVAAGEAGGITQHIGAYSVEHEGSTITFLDTPGHAAFSSMRARGAKVTDIVILVVAADDGVMPQTVEAISHAKDAGVPIIVAVNKIDKPNLNLERIYSELTEHGIQAEEWGGEHQFIKVSALKKTGIDKLLEAIVLQAEVLDLKAPVEGNAEATVIEAHLDKGRGPVATLVVNKGTLRIGDYIVAGSEVGRVRGMRDHLGRDKKEAGPAIPVEVIGLSGVPRAGDSVNVVTDEKTAREVADMRADKARQAAAGKSAAASLDDLLNRVKTADVPEVPIILKADTQGSVEAISEALQKLSTPKVRTRVVHAAVGGISESDITLAQTSGSLLVGFNVRAARGLDDTAQKAGVVLKYFSIIYEIVDAVKALMVGKLPPIVSEVILGHAEVRKPISVPKIGTIAGSAVLDGKITRNAHCRLIRDSVVIYTGKLGSLRRFKDDVKEVAQGYECGIGIDGYNDLKEGDVIEAYALEETAATL